MGRLRGWLRKLEREAKGEALLQIPQEFGGTFVQERSEVAVELFSFYCQCALADGAGEERPEAPDVLRAVANAIDRRAALHDAMQGYRYLAYDPEVLVREGVLEPVSMVADMTYAELIAQGGIPDLSDQGLAERGEEC